MTISFRAAFFSVLLFATITPAGSLAAEFESPIGLWKTIDDATGSPRALVRIYEQDGKLFGQIEKVFDAQPDNQVCTACKDDRKNQSIIGLIIVRNIVQLGHEYGGGDILDPESGSVYRCKMHLEAAGSRLMVRGYIGFSFLGRSQSWQRQT
jgi:uncharacterized protein (DUF2147 family)